jgi:hypothetical protein
MLAEMVPIHTKRIALADERKESTMTMPFCSLAERLLFCPFYEITYIRKGHRPIFTEV